MKRSIIAEIIIILFMILFIYTGISKWMDYTVFKEQIAESPALAPFASILAWILPLTEFIVSILLMIPGQRLKGLYASLTLMIIFTVYVIVLTTSNDQLPCSCGGVLAELSWPQHIIFNIVFIVLAIIGILLEKKIKLQNEKHKEWQTISSEKINT